METKKFPANSAWKLLEVFQHNAHSCYVGNLFGKSGDKRIEALTREVKHGDKISLGDHVTITCLYTPCHTSGHMLYYVEDTVNTSNTAVFTGDTLFVGTN